jgi:cystathionine beta-lyase
MVAQLLRKLDGVEEVLNPADPEDAGHARFKRYFSRGTGLVSFVPARQDLPSLAAMIDGFTHFRIGASWGGTESLVALTDLSAARTARKSSAGPYIVRLHIGLEPLDELIEDLQRGIERMMSHPMVASDTAAATAT